MTDKRIKHAPSKKSCFIISPIGAEGGDIRRRADKVLKHVIRPPLEERGYSVVRADHIADPGMITTQVIDKIREADLVVADLSGHNPNVFYELAVRHALNKPFIQIIESGEQIPFDIAGFRTIHLDHTDLDSADEARKEIGNQVDAIEGENFKLVTPLSFSVDMTSFAASEDKESVYISRLFDAVSSLQAQLAAMDRRLARGGFDSDQGLILERALRNRSEKLQYLEHENARLISELDELRSRREEIAVERHALRALGEKARSGAREK
ncbi:hypothetical protein [Rhodovulum adriaticum]|uniref:Nucleoside 2-deoxyribosyltransferase-like protein n=1 Tax=Rhodovulum adriaticum TaxID=35804 RepID=A0A4R2NLZ2_RHOAD|nr:hypothetical protein [Rhodovulum adriaticum]TCP22244.1 hypothetical protein EV656_10752 [Rhodovulum adriaticum]